VSDAIMTFTSELFEGVQYLVEVEAKLNYSAFWQVNLSEPEPF